MLEAATAKATTERRMERVALGIVCTFFPSRIQPWLVTSIEQAMSRGAEPVIYALKSDWSEVPEKVARLDLVRRTCYVRPGSAIGPIGALARACWPPDPFSADSRRGIARLILGGHLSIASPTRAASTLALAPAAGREPLEVIHAHSLVPAYYFTLVAQALKIPFLFTFHGLPPAGVGMLPKERAGAIFSAAARVFVNTRFAASQVADLGCPNDRIVVLPQGLVLGDFPFRPRKLDTGLPITILTVGRLQPDKGHRYALEAIARLIERGFDIRYRIVGIGNQREELRALADKLGLADRVEFLAGLSDEALRAEYAQAHLFLLPSVRDRVGRHEETQGVVIQEAQASGCIVVATRTGGIPECVDDGRSTFLAPDRDANGLADALERVLRAPELWEDWQHAGRRWVEDRFDATAIGARQWEIYQDVLAECRRSGMRA